jgi:hypothetical protein
MLKPKLRGAGKPAPLMERVHEENSGRKKWLKKNKKENSLISNTKSRW